MRELIYNDLSHVVRRLPTDIRSLLKEYEGRLFVAGGFVRAVVAGEKPSDIDIFGISKEVLERASGALAERRGEGTRVHKTKNAITVISVGRITVQFITRWTFSEAKDCAAAFDFTVCQSVIWRDQRRYFGLCSPSFYSDLASRRLVYTCPARIEEAGGSLMRVMKFVKRGYVIQADSLARVVARLAIAFQHDQSPWEEGNVGRVFTGLLREVDPNMAIDGLDVHDDHETPIDGLPEEAAP